MTQGLCTAAALVVLAGCTLDFTRPGGADGPPNGGPRDGALGERPHDRGGDRDGPRDDLRSGADGDAAAAKCWGNVSNFAPSDGTLQFAQHVVISCDATFDSTTREFTTWCGGTKPIAVIQSQGGTAPAVAVVPMASFQVQAGQTLRLVGALPVVLAVAGDATIDGIIDAGAVGTTPGAGGDDPTNGQIATAGTVGGPDCALFEKGTGEGKEDGSRALGGGGAGFRTNGGFGGGDRPNFRCYEGADSYECKPLCPDLNCDNSYSSSSTRFRANNSAHHAAAPVRGLAAPNQSLSPLRGGCAGGKGDGPESPFYGGAGGGAVQISVKQTLTLGASGIVSAGGGGGSTPGGRSGGAGGGAGGAILLEARQLSLAGAASIRAHGGSGGGRDCAGTAENGHVADDGHASHPACVAEGRGGLSYWNVTEPGCNGSTPTVGAAATCTLPLLGSGYSAYPQAGQDSDNNGGGGGGGSGGVIVVHKLTGAVHCY